MTTNYYRRLGDTLDPAFYARVLQAAVRRLRALVGSYQNINFSMLAAKNATRGSLVWKQEPLQPRIEVYRSSKGNVR